MKTRYSYICRLGDTVINTEPHNTLGRTRIRAKQCYRLALRDGLITKQQHDTGAQTLRVWFDTYYYQNKSQKINREPIPSQYVVDPKTELHKLQQKEQLRRIAELQAACPAYIKHKQAWLKHQLLKDDPAFRERRRQATRAWYARDREHGLNVSRRSLERIANGTSRPKARGTKLR